MYEKGIFEPHPIPQCLEENGMKLLPMDREKTPAYDKSNSSRVPKEAYQNIYPSTLHDDFQGQRVNTFFPLIHDIVFVLLCFFLL